MNKHLLPLLCFSNFILLLQAVDLNEENFSSEQVYNPNALFSKILSRLQSFLRFDTESQNSKSDLEPHVGFQQHGNISKCMGDLFYVLHNLKNQWALNMLDSFGKPESGILQGNLKWVGDYNECIQVRSTNPNSETVGNFRGKYCSLTWSLPIPNMSLPPIETGVCVPDSCSTSELQSILKLSQAGGEPVLNDTTFSLKASITCKPLEHPLSAPAKAVIALLSIFCTLVVAGSSITAVNYFKKAIKDPKQSSITMNVAESQFTAGDGGNIQEKNFGKEIESFLEINTSRNQAKGKLQTFFSCFCMFTNGAKILNTDSSEGQLLCIHGIRFLSMSWVILGHTYVYSVGEVVVLRNIAEAIRLIDNLPFQVLAKSVYAVDSFFVLSGFLLTYLFMKEYTKSKGVISWPYFYIHRYIRLTPMYMVILGFFASVYVFLGSGPFLPVKDLEPNCRDSWWWNLLYVNNFRPMEKMCMDWSWYLANDMQFFVISPIFLITLWRSPKIGYGLLSLFLFTSCLTNFVITYYYGLTVGMSIMLDNPNMIDREQGIEVNAVFSEEISTKPYTRIGPYLIGIFLGYILFKRKTSSKPKYSWGFLSAGWIVATIVTLTCVYGLYQNRPGVLASSFYNAFNRSCFAAGLSWVIYVCLIGQAGVVNSILSWKLFIPLSRLTYAAYLIHPMVITWYFQSLKQSIEFSHQTMVIIYLGIMLETYALALPVALVLEYPVVSLEKLVRKAFTEKQVQEPAKHI